MKRMRLWEWAVSLACVAAVGMAAIALLDRQRNGPTPLMMGAGADVTAVRVIVTDEAGRHRCVIDGPAGTIEIIDERGRAQRVSLATIAGLAKRWGEMP